MPPYQLAYCYLMATVPEPRIGLCCPACLLTSIMYTSPLFRHPILDSGTTGVICAIVSHPADTVVSKMGKGGKSAGQVGALFMLLQTQ